MGGLSTSDALYLAIAFLVPGFIFSAMRNAFITGQERQGTEQLLRFLAYSGVNYAAFGWLVLWATESGASSVVRALAWGAVILLGPALLGLAAGAATQKGWGRRALACVGLSPVHAVPTAWDYKFGRMPCEWVIVTLKDGTRFAGWFGAQSFASSEQKERDLFVQQTYDLDEANNWIATDRSLLVAHGEIRTIEFWPDKLGYSQPEQRSNDEQERKADDDHAPVGLDFAPRLSTTTDGVPPESSGRTSANDGTGRAGQPTSEPGERRQEVIAQHY